jgi:hypothetical protein
MLRRQKSKWTPQIKRGWARFESRHQRADGSVLDIEVNVAVLHSKDYLIALLTDITERKQAESVVRRKNRALLALSASNHALIHAANEQSLLDEVCTTLQVWGTISLAYAGMMSNSGNRLPTESRRLYRNSGDLGRMAQDWPAGTTVKTGQISVIEDTQTDRGFGAWRQHAADFGAFDLTTPSRIPPTLACLTCTQRRHPQPMK